MSQPPGVHVDSTACRSSAQADGGHAGAVLVELGQPTGLAVGDRQRRAVLAVRPDRAYAARPRRRASPGATCRCALAAARPRSPWPRARAPLEPRSAPCHRHLHEPVGTVDVATHEARDLEELVDRRVGGEADDHHAVSLSMNRMRCVRWSRDGADRARARRHHHPVGRRRRERREHVAARRRWRRRRDHTGGRPEALADRERADPRARTHRRCRPARRSPRSPATSTRRWIIHTAGPVYSGSPRDAELLASLPPVGAAGRRRARRSHGRVPGDLRRASSATRSSEAAPVAIAVGREGPRRRSSRCASCCSPSVTCDVVPGGAREPAGDALIPEPTPLVASLPAMSDQTTNDDLSRTCARCTTGSREIQLVDCRELYEWEAGRVDGRRLPAAQLDHGGRRLRPRSRDSPSP